MISLTPLGHATVLMEIDGFRVITDPVLGDRVGMSIGPLVLGARRLQPPPLRADQLPPIDLVLLSHAHYDHTDTPTLRKLPRSAVAIVQNRNRDLVRRFHDRRALRWGQETLISRDGQPFLRVTAVPSRHWGARALIDPWRGWGGYLLEVLNTPSPEIPSQPLSILFAGDTAKTDVYQKLARTRGAGVDLAIMPIGAYDPWIQNHCSPEQAWQMGIHDLRARRLMPIHFDTFRMSREPIGEPLRRLLTAAQQDGLQARLFGTKIGQTYQLPHKP